MEGQFNSCGIDVRGQTDGEVGACGESKFDEKTSDGPRQESGLSGRIELQQVAPQDDLASSRHEHSKTSGFPGTTEQTPNDIYLTLTVEERVRKLDIVLLAMTNRWHDGLWTWWCRCPSGGEKHGTRTEAALEFLDWCERISKKNPGTIRTINQ